MFSQDEKDLLERIARAVELLALELPIAIADAAWVLQDNPSIDPEYEDRETEARELIGSLRRRLVEGLTKKEEGRNSGRGGK